MSSKRIGAREAAERLGISQRAVQKAVQAGRLKASLVKAGAVVALEISESEVARYGKAREAAKK